MCWIFPEREARPEMFCECKDRYEQTSIYNYQIEIASSRYISCKCCGKLIELDIESESLGESNA